MADVLMAKDAGGVLNVEPNAIVTPSAKEGAERLGVRLEAGSRKEPSTAASPVLAARGENTPAAPLASAVPGNTFTQEESDGIPDIREQDLFDSIPFSRPHDSAILARLRKSGPARICLDRAGPRYKTKSLLQFQADHAAAVDAAFTDVSQVFLEKEGLPTFQTLCKDRDEYLRRPDLGRTLTSESLQDIVKITGRAPRVLIYYADGLSSTALELNGPDTYHSMVAGLKRHGIEPCPPIFVRWARVPSQDCISEATGAEVVCTLIGERPGLVSSESLSVYFSYKATIDMPEARRTVISNIHRGGTPAVEAGAYIADIIKLMLDKKASGTDLPL